MFGIDGSEFVVILLVLIIVIGPKDLPKILKAIAKVRAYVCSTVNELRYQFDDAIRQIELDNLQKTCSDINDLNPSKKLTETFDPIQDAVEDIHDNSDVKATHHKLEKDEELWACDQKTTNTDVISITPYHSESIFVVSKDKEDVS
ncbi:MULTISPECIES: Sec-independent protein translocase protein TatB [unclassified Bartonella]|uniref:Sec-independent protein translocase protein TatB n=1 Tax=unclassified Bartonella TaxID=2645622 RepID=UPI0035CF71AD